MCGPGLHILYLTSFEMVMHCLKYSGKQSSTTNANMCCRFDLIIISTPKFRLFLYFQHQINYWISSCAIASIISIINPSCWLLLYPPLDDSVIGLPSSQPEQSLIFLLSNNGREAILPPICYIYTLLSFMLTFHLFALTHTFDPCVPALSLSWGIKDMLLLYCSVFMDLYRTSWATRSAEGNRMAAAKRLCWKSTWE